MNPALPVTLSGGGYYLGLLVLDFLCHELCHRQSNMVARPFAGPALIVCEVRKFLEPFEDDLPVVQMKEAVEARVSSRRILR
jgi:hypothetical protein